LTSLVCFLEVRFQPWRAGREVVSMTAHGAGLRDMHVHAQSRRIPRGGIQLRRLIPVIVCVSCVWLRADVLTVGEGKQYATIEDATAAAGVGDTIEVYPAVDDGVYHRPAVYVTKGGLRFVGKAPGGGRIVLDGDGFNYSGVGSTPRAIFQINRGADGVVIEGFELRNARNDSYNGAGVRINQANGVTVRRCSIHHNQMGIMSNGSEAGPAADQLIEFCALYENGAPEDPGYNHNLYLGGRSVTMQFCEVRDAVTGHNVKSRAHFNLFQYNYVHDSANREFDLVDAAETDAPNSNAVLIGNFIVKKDPIDGNTNVIHFGRDGGHGHNGTVFISNNTIVTPHYGPVIMLSAAKARARLVNNVIFNNRQNGPQLYRLVNINDPRVIEGDHNWLSAGYDASDTALDPDTTYHGDTRDSDPGFVCGAARDFRLGRQGVARWAPNPLPVYRDGTGAWKSAIPVYEYAGTDRRKTRGGQAARYIGAGVEWWARPGQRGSVLP